MRKILVVSHDAGAANVLSSLIKKYHDDFDWTVCVFGPAKNIFIKNRVNSYSKALNLGNSDVGAVLKLVKPDLVLTGTSWESNIEIDFIKSAKANNINSASFLDHWVNYRERFGYPDGWKKNLPDIIFVGDEWAYKIALKKGFPKKILFQVENPYFEEIIKQVKKIKQKRASNNKDKKIKILYLSEPTSLHALKKHHNAYYWGYTEYEALKDLLEIVKLEKGKVLLRLKIRLHPAEKINKYSRLLKKERYSDIRKLILVSQPDKNSLIQDCAWADMAIGSDTMALVIALMIGNKTISYIPTHKISCSLPQKEIKKISSKEKLTEEINSFHKNQPPIMRGIYHLSRNNTFKKFWENKKV